MNKKNPVVSVITVTYNAESVLEKTILSVLHQSFSNIEYLIIDGASNDTTLDIIKKYQMEISYWISEPDLGIYDAMNKGCLRARGEWIIFLNAGDVFYNEDILMRLFFKKKYINADVLYGNISIFNPKTDKSLIQRAESPTDKKPMSFCHQAVFVRTRIMKQFLFDVHYRICADKDFFFKIYRLNVIFEFVDIVVSEILMFGLSTSNRLQNLLEANEIYYLYGSRTKAERLIFIIKAYVEDFIILSLSNLKRFCRFFRV